MTSSPEGGVIEMKPVGVVHSDHTEPNKVPIQAALAAGCRGTVEVFPEYAEGLKDIEGFSHIYLLCYFHRARPSQLVVTPFLDDVEHGVFATRSPARPNPIGLSVVELLDRRDNVLYVDGLDILDGTPVLDIKPYSTRFGGPAVTRDGWLEGVSAERVQAGRRVTAPV